MHTATLALTLDRVEHDLRDVDRRLSMPGWLIRALATISSVLITRELHCIAEPLSNGVLRLYELTRLVDEFDDAELIDPDGAKAVYFDTLLSKLKRSHAKAGAILALAESTRKAGIALAAAQLADVLAEFHEAAAKLAWAIAEHDASHAPRLSGFTASNVEELEAMLDRVSGEA